MRLEQILNSLDSILGKNLQITRIPEALTNASYQITGQREKWALRINNPRADLFGIDREREHQILQTIQQTHFTAPVISITKDYLLTQWVTGTKYTVDSIEQLNPLINFCQAIHQHATPTLSETKSLDIRQQIQTLKYGITLPRSTEQQLASLIREYRPASEQRLCHHDWHKGNLIKTETDLFLIDWEYAALGDPIVDWACLSSGFNLPSDFINELIVKVGIDKDRFSIALALVEMMSILWFNQRYSEKNWQQDYHKWTQRWA